MTNETTGTVLLRCIKKTETFFLYFPTVFFSHCRISQTFFGILQPMFGQNPEFLKFGFVFERLLGSIKSELSMWNRPGQNITIGDVLNSDTALNNFVLVSCISFAL